MMPRGRPRKARTADATQTDLENNKLRHETTHKCDLCLITFLKESLYRIHLHKHEKTDKPYHCDQCSMSFNIEYNLTLHKLTHGLNDASCPVCNKNFNRVASLKAHIMSHMKEETLVCTECGDEFILQSQLSLHMEEHQQESMGSKTYSCVSCEESFKTPLLLKEHIKTHVKIRVVRAKADNRNIDRSGFRYSCPHCGKKFKRRDQVTCHAMIHTGDKPFKCTLCRKAFIQKSVLVTHIATHTGEKPHSCSLCPSSFSQKGTLQSHLQKVHSEVKNGVSFQCTHCNCVFKSVGSRSRHINKMHGTRSEGTSTSTEGAAHMTLQGHGLPPALPVDHRGLLTRGPICYSASVQTSPLWILGLWQVKVSIPASARQRLLFGLAKASVSETECLANQTGDEKENRDAAVSVPEGNNAKRNICTYCNKEFKKPSCLVKHIRIHTREKPFKCKECFRGFASKGNLTAHMKTHTGIKAFNCNCCKKRFSTSGSLKVHLRLHTGETPYACPHCDKKFKTYGLRETHITTHLTPCELKNLREQRKLRKVCPRKPVISMSEITLEEPILVSKLGIMQPIPRGRQFFQEALINSYAYEVDRPHKCSHCPRAYKKSCELKLHIR
uniref:C2H2-type domain-containing protein n=1 Tax=Leptobrachium leishanense TaxID=445787 RepID=A0A8C5MDV9_9ANUR